MQDDLTQLLILQDRDLRKQQIENDLQRIPLEEKQIERTLATQSSDYEAHKKAAQQIEVNRKELDNEVKSKEALISKYQNQQLQTKKNDEYQALGHEIDRAKQEISTLEDQELELMEQYEGAQKEVSKEAEKVKDYEKTANARRDALKSKATALNKELEELNKAIAEQETKCSEGNLHMYRRILKSKGDRAIVKVDNGKNCSGCHMTITHQEILEAKAGKITHCGHCGCLLFWQDEFA
ncbi:MAG: C4-type zinc ribbon domain-containing protein [Verrucomicrobiota bacterium]